MASSRPYRKRMNNDKIMKELKWESDKQFDPKVVITFRNIANHIDFNIKEIKN